ncbi:MAG: HPr kinase/phosphatase C-terminal domain-containing protein [Pseudoruegeria sp.]
MVASSLTQKLNRALAMKAPVHATSVSVSGRGVLICGKSGSGKSSLAMEMLALGAILIADDQTILSQSNGAIELRCPFTIDGLIEARGMGILRCPSAGATPLSVIVDLERDEAERCPPEREIDLVGHSVPLLFNVPARQFPAALMIFLRHGRSLE